MSNMNEMENEVSEKEPLSILINIENAESYITKKEVINALRPSDSAIDIIGIVKSIQNPYTTEKDGRTLTVFNFVIECDGINVPVAVWDEDIPRIKPFIILDMIIHLDSPFTRPQTPSKWTYGKEFTLTCRSNTMVNTLGKVKSQVIEKKNYKEFSIIEQCLSCLDDNETIALNVAVKTAFRKENEKNNKLIGAVADTETKLTVYIMNDDSEVILEKGERVKMIGQLIEISNKIYFEVKNSTYIQKLNDEKISEEVLDGIFKTPKRKMVSMNNQVTGSNEKKIKFE